MLTEAKFKIISRDEEPFDEPADRPKLTRAHVKNSFHGDLSGTGLSDERAAGLPYALRYP